MNGAKTFDAIRRWSRDRTRRVNPTIFSAKTFDAIRRWSLGERDTVGNDWFCAKTFDAIRRWSQDKNLGVAEYHYHVRKPLMPLGVDHTGYS